MTQMWNEIHEQPAVIERCLKANAGPINKIADVIKSRGVDFVVIAARGTSDHAAVYGKYVIELSTGIPVALAASSVFTVYGRSLNLRNSLVIAISQSGRAADVLEVIRSANKEGAVTLSITNSPGSPLANEATYHLYCEAGPERSVAATKSFMAQIFLLGQLAAKWAGNKDMELELSLVPDKISQTIEILSSVIEEKTARYRFMDECFVLARGINYAVALEAALKIQETTYVRAKAFATSDFQHGPIAMVEKDMPVMAFAPDGPSFKYMEEIVDRLKQKQVELIMVSNVKKMLDEGTCSFEIPGTENDIISPFMNAAVAQMFACKLAVIKGLNPDSPRELNKVTVTL